jgi:membrane protein required for colicin V production
MISILDIAILVLLAATTAFGVWKGFVRIAIGVAGLLISLALSLRLAEQGPVWFPQIFRHDHLARAAAFGLVLVLGLIATSLIGWLTFRLLQAAELGWLDRCVGGGVGLIGGVLTTAGLAVGLVSLLPPGSGSIKHSRCVHAALKVVDAAAVILPPQMSAAYKERRRALEA